MKTVHVVEHSYEWCGRDEVKLIGVYSKHSEATAAITRLRGQPGFRDWPDGFSITRWKLGVDSWREGFATMVNILVPCRENPDSCQGASSAWRPGDQYEICSLDKTDDAVFAIGDVVRCEERDAGDGTRVLVAVALAAQLEQ